MSAVRISLRMRFESPHQVTTLATAAEDLGLHGVWVSEPWGYDASAVLGHCAALTRQILLGTHVSSVFARTPAATAGMAASLQTLSEGRFRLGLGTSGPAVVEAWHGVPFLRPLGRTRDVVAVVRAALTGQPLEYTGATVALPLDGRPLRFAQLREPIHVPIYLGALGPANQRLTAEVADGWTPTPYSPDHHASFAAPLEAGISAFGRQVQIAPVCPVVVAPTAGEALDIERRWSAFYLGGMGAFYARAATSMGFGAMAERVVAAWARGDRRAARAAVDDGYMDSIGLFGPPERIRERVDRYVAAGADELVVELRRPGLEDQLADLRQLAGAVA